MNGQSQEKAVEFASPAGQETLHPERFLTITPLAPEAVETPIPIIDLAVVERNVQRLQAHCDRLGIKNRPHIKTHKSAGLARFQIASGAAGITVQKLGEAEVMADHGITDMMLTFNVTGAAKIARLAALMRRTTIKVVADNDAILDGLDDAASLAGRPLDVLVECDTGAGRAGVQSPEAAVDLARAILRRPGLRFGGLMTYPKPGIRAESAAFLRKAKRLCDKTAFQIDTISTGGSPDQWSEEGIDIATEYRAGTSIYCDRSLIARGMARQEDCALGVLVTVVSRPVPTRALIDAGTKALTSDLLGLEGFGMVRDRPDIRIVKLDEEHGYLELPASAPLAVGDQLRIIPNHVCPVSNLFDRVLVERDGTLLGSIPVDARGKVS
jgi:D-serine deaminase-like pyridoxal phosphate-dependent protein